MSLFLDLFYKVIISKPFYSVIQHLPANLHISFLLTNLWLIKLKKLQKKSLFVFQISFIYLQLNF